MPSRFNRIIDKSITSKRTATACPGARAAAGSEPIVAGKHRFIGIRFQAAAHRELEAFAGEPDEQVHRFRVRKDRRRHLHSQIDGQRLDSPRGADIEGTPD